MPSIGFATYSRLPDLSDEDQLAAAALDEVGIVVEPVVWDDPAAHWARFDAVVIRSCWDYHHRPNEFVEWITGLERLGVPLWNPPDLLRWNMHKHYLRELQRQGVPIVPTVWLEQGASADLAALLAQQGWSEVVVKPAVSASAFGTWRTAAAKAEHDQSRLVELLARGAVLVQAFQTAVCDEGEWSLIFFAGEYSHAVLKRPRPGDFRVQGSAGGVAVAALPPRSVILEATRVVEAIEGPWLYARVDGLVVDGTFCLMELELIEPYLFATYAQDGVAHFAAALNRALR